MPGFDRASAALRHPDMPADLPESSATPLAEISQGPSAFEQFLDRNQKNLIILAVLIAVGTAAFVVYRGVADSREKTAGNALNKAEDLAALQAVVNDHPGTRASHTAMILLAERQWSEGQQDTAIETLRKFIAGQPEHPALGSAKASLGTKLMAQGKGGDAAALFQEIADDPKERFVAPFALISLGDLAKAGGDLAKAESHYNRVKTDFPDSGFAETATQRSASLKAKAPQEIDPPPAPKPEEKPAAAAPATTPPGITITPVPADGAGPAPATGERPPTANVQIPEPSSAAPPAPAPAPPAPPVETPAQEKPADAGSGPQPESQTPPAGP